VAVQVLALSARVRLAASIGVAAIVVACGAQGSRSPVGISDRPAGGSTTKEARDGGMRDAAGALPYDYRASFTKVNKSRFGSQGHAAGRWTVDVFANDVAHKALASRARDVPAGAVVVQEHYEQDGRAGPVMLMEKRAKGYAPDHGDWRWVVVGSRGQLVEDGVVESCAGCHDEAPMDGLFPIVE
jgi:hypothetical protein